VRKSCNLLFVEMNQICVNLDAFLLQLSVLCKKSEIKCLFFFANVITYLPLARVYLGAFSPISHVIAS
jgi:hypothetical protein